MIKVMVVIWGLVMYVPDGTPQNLGHGLTALFVNGQHVAGQEHVSRVRLFETAQADDWTLQAPHFAITMKVPGEMADPVPDRFLAIQDWVPEGVDGAVRSECLNGDSACAAGGHRLVRGTVRFEGDWKIRSASMCRILEYPPGYHDAAVWDLRQTADGPPQNHTATPDGRLATALVLEADIEDLSDLEVLFGLPAEQNQVKLGSDAVCNTYVGEGATGSAGCVYIEMYSEPVEEFPDTCDEPDPGPECRFDTHFSAFYDLLEGYDDSSEEPAPARWLPYLKDNYDSCYSPSFAEQMQLHKNPGHDPVPRCPGTHAFAQAGS